MAAAVFQHQYYPSSKAFFFEIPAPPVPNTSAKNGLPRYKLTEKRFKVYDMEMALTIVQFFGNFIRVHSIQINMLCSTDTSINMVMGHFLIFRLMKNFQYVI